MKKLSSPVKVDEEHCRNIGEHLKRLNLKFYSFGKYRGNFLHPPLSLGRVVWDFEAACVTQAHHMWHVENGKIVTEYGFIDPSKHDNLPKEAVDYINKYNGWMKGQTFLDLKTHMMFQEDPETFSMKRMANADKKFGVRWLSDDRGVLPLFGGLDRLVIAREFARKVLERWGDFYSLIEKSDNKLIDNGKGFLELIRVLPGGWNDWPFQKKGHYFRKIFERRTGEVAHDVENKKLPLDYHAGLNVPIIYGIIKFDKEMLEKIKNLAPPLLGEDIEFRIRSASDKAYRIISEASGWDPLELDDIAWSDGRNCFQPNPPKHENSKLASFVLKNLESNPELRGIKYLYPQEGTLRY